jgi:hypothetical protein
MASPNDSNGVLPRPLIDLTLLRLVRRLLLLLCRSVLRGCGSFLA